MDKFAIRPEQERREILAEAASRRDLAEIIIEKDFWVCWTLKRLFSNQVLASHLTFKGGTSLSKAYGLIERFSEDIDLTISRNAPFLADGKNPMEEGISGKEIERRIDAVKANAQLFVERIALPMLEADIKEAFANTDNWKLVLDIEDPERQTILFYYPKVFAYGTEWGSAVWGEAKWGDESYIRPHVKLEFGARGEIEPHQPCVIAPYVAETFPKLFEAPSCSVSTLAAKRTFWEKVTILHALHHGSRQRDRMSRHYYDTYMLSQKGVADEAMQTPALLEAVVRNKSLLFRDSKASYETAVIGSLKLLPTAGQKEMLRKDYEKMAEMFIGEPLTFDAILVGLTALEARINKA